MQPAVKILDNQSILKKVIRMAHQAKEEFFEETEIVLISISGQGTHLCKLILEEMKKNKFFDKLVHFDVVVDKKSPWKPLYGFPDKGAIENKAVLIVDDVLNSGRTIWYLFHAFQGIQVKSLKVMVLVDRNHLKFPVRADIAGMSLATTLSGNIISKLDKKEEYSVFLE
ncbi:MAG: phosphoribosyltransferase family protein [Bacteroidia bacterium]|nr:phosphoribosyltransferase family protein [Bacteroidia bacterium]